MPEYRLLCDEGCYLFHKEDALKAEADRKAVEEYKKLDTTCANLLNNLFECEGQLDDADADLLRTIQELETEVATNKRAVWWAFGLGVVLSFGAAFAISQAK